MNRIGASRRFRLFLLWSARLALFAYIFQIAAFDHWSRHASDYAEIVGIPGTQTHTLHCHGASSGCADSAGLTGSLDDVTLTPLAPSRFTRPVVVAATMPRDAYRASIDEPPRV